MVPHSPPNFVTSPKDGSRAGEAPADFLECNAVRATDIAHEGEKVTLVELRDHAQAEARV
jgi:hypothetical protein